MDFLKNEFRKQYASKLQKIRLNFAVLLVVSALKTVGWRFLLRENGFVINHPLHMRVLPLVSCGPPWSLWSPVVSCRALWCAVHFPYAVVWYSVCTCFCCCVWCLHLVFSMRLVCVWSLVCPLIGSFIALSVRSFVRSLVCFFCLFVSLVDVNLLFLWSGIVGSWLVSFARCFWSICWLVQVRKNMLYESPPR